MPQLLGEDDKSFQVKDDSSGRVLTIPKSMVPEDQVAALRSTATGPATDVGQVVPGQKLYPAEGGAKQAAPTSVQLTDDDLNPVKPGEAAPQQAINPKTGLIETQAQPGAAQADNGPVDLAAYGVGSPGAAAPAGHDVRASMSAPIGTGALAQVQRNLTKGKDAIASRYKEGETKQDEAFKNERAAVQTQVEIGAQQAAREAAYQEEMVNRQKQFMADQTALAKEKETKLAEQQKRIDDALTDVRNTKIDETGGFGEMPKRIGSAIAIAFGQFSAGMNGGANVAADIIDKQVQRGIQKDIANRDHKKGIAKDQQDAYTKMLEKFGDKEQALLGVKIQGIELAKMQIESSLAQTQDETKRAQGQQIIAQLDQKQQDYKNNLIKSREDELLQRDMGIASVAGQRAQLDLASRAARAKQEGDDLSIPGLKGQAKTKESYGTAAKIHGNSAALNDQVVDLENDIKGTGSEIMPTDKAIELQAKARALMIAVKAGAELGTLDKGSEKFLEEMVDTDPTKIRTGAVMAKLRALRTTNGIKTKAQLRSYGFEYPGSSFRAEE